ncbi:HNH endonuclease [Priestia aryabhattai]|uniref:HNH endonuclease n=1 Tax=Priestia aryabhattai TaxID=412384 RepID=UPI0039834195
MNRKLKKEVLERDNYTCQICGFEGTLQTLDLDHITPKRLNGSDSLDNLITMCMKCNSSIYKLAKKEQSVDSKKLNTWVNKYFSTSVPNNLCHYTNLNAAKGILDTKEMWLSNVRTMNDPDELSYGYRLITMALEELEVNGIFQPYQKTLENLKEVMKQLAEQKVIVGNAEIYLTCFSAARNTIRQWVTYGDTANGVSLMFNGKISKNKHQVESLLINRGAEQAKNEVKPFSNTDVYSYEELSPDVKETIDLYKENYYGFKEVQYVEEDNAKQSRFFQDLKFELIKPLTELFSDSDNNNALNNQGATQYVKLIREGEKISSIATNFFIKMALWALSVKHLHWQDEKEWRLILLLHSPKVNNYNTHFLIKPNMMVPFIKYFISPEDILEICLGPKTNKTMTQLALSYYIKANPVYDHLLIEKSNIKMA